MMTRRLAAAAMLLLACGCPKKAPGNGESPRLTAAILEKLEEAESRLPDPLAPHMDPLWRDEPEHMPYTDSSARTLGFASLIELERLRLRLYSAQADAGEPSLLSGCEGFSERKAERLKDESQLGKKTTELAALRECLEFEESRCTRMAERVRLRASGRAPRTLDAGAWLDHLDGEICGAKYNVGPGAAEQARYILPFLALRRHQAELAAGQPALSPEERRLATGE
jgi:hypothetical protein